MFQFFDIVYCLNQDSRPDRWMQAEKEFARIDLQRVQRIPTIPADVPFHSFCLSQQNLLIQFLATGGSTLLALEDDVIFKALGHLDEALHDLPPDWDMVYLGANILEPKPEMHSKHLCRLRSAWTTHAIGYSRKMVEHIVANYPAQEFAMYDDWLSRNILPNFNCYIVNPIVAWQRPVYSDLWGHHVSYGWEQQNLKML